MQIEITGTNVPVTDELREHVERHFSKVARTVSELATCDVVLGEERNPAIAEGRRCEATIHLKGTSLHAKQHAREMQIAIHKVADELERQARRHREKLRGSPGDDSIRHVEPTETESA